MSDPLQGSEDTANEQDRHSLCHCRTYKLTGNRDGYLRKEKNLDGDIAGRLVILMCLAYADGLLED